MLLAVDIGNTNINLGLFRGNHLTQRRVIPVKSKDYRARLKKIAGRGGITGAIISSVVPEVTGVLEKALAGLLGRRPYIIGKDTAIPMKNLYRKPGQAGSDRLVNAYAGAVFYGAPLIVVDFGTAITFDVISRSKEYIGGMILPGLGISLDALAESTALLPKIRLEPPKEFIGRDTKSSILSGVVYGFASLTDSLAERIKNKIGKGALVIGTGGNVKFISKYCRILDKTDPDLTLKGLNLIYKKIS